jgi:calpain-15
LLDFDENQFIMSASCGVDDVSVSKLEDMGLVAAHAYTIIAVKQEADSDGEEVRLVQLRNPWGKFEWNGDWSDTSPRWSEELRDAVGWSNADDGTFWMCFEDFKRYFKWVQVCKLNDEYNYSFTECQQKPLDDYNLQKLLVV